MVKVWVAGCWACVEDRCIVIYDHKPTTDELLKIFCDTVVDNSLCEWLCIKEVELEYIFNKLIDDVFD